MFSPGATLRAAREKRRLSVADVVEATRIKRHLIEAIENNDFSGISAPLYGKGFIKLYAELVGLDPAPLIQDYMARYARTVRPSLKSERPPVAANEQGLPPPSTLDRFRSSGGAAWRRAMDDVSLALAEAAERVKVTWAAWRTSWRGGMSVPRRYARGAVGPLGFPVWRYAAVAAVLVVLVVLLATGVRHLIRHPREVPRSTTQKVVKPALSPRPLRLVEEPPPAYIRVKTP
jgi:transcriptional regulator with XRE-family HTH domain